MPEVKDKNEKKPEKICIQVMISSALLPARNAAAINLEFTIWL